VKVEQGLSAPQPHDANGFITQFQRQARLYVSERRRYFAEHRNYGLEFIETHLNGLPPNSAILDVGCGGGDDLKHFRSKGFENVYGIDPSDAMLQEALAYAGERSRIELGQWQSMPFGHGRFDCIFGDYSLHYCPDAVAAYRESARILRSGGRLVAALSHPFFDISNQEAFGSNSGSYIEAKLYNGRFPVRYPVHQMTDYFNTAFLELFDLVDVVEFSTTAKSINDCPTGFGFAAIRR